MTFEEFIVFRNVKIRDKNHEKIIKLFYPFLSSVCGNVHTLPNLIGELLDIDLSATTVIAGCFNKSVVAKENVDFYIKFENEITVFIYSHKTLIDLNPNEYAIFVFGDSLIGDKTYKGNLVIIK